MITEKVGAGKKLKVYSFAIKLIREYNYNYSIYATTTLKKHILGYLKETISL